jgi:hypothetical protein
MNLCIVEDNRLHWPLITSCSWIAVRLGPDRVYVAKSVRHPVQQLPAPKIILTLCVPYQECVLHHKQYSASGVTQGNPLVMLGYALGMMSLTRQRKAEFPGVDLGTLTTRRQLPSSPEFAPCLNAF